MWRVGCLSLVLVAGTMGFALACDDHVGECKLDGWQARHSETMGVVFFDASSTCDKGRAIVRLYDGAKFLGVASGRIEGHALETLARVAKGSDIEDLKIKYSINPN